MSNTLWIFISLVMGVIVTLVCELLASSICSRKEDNEKNNSVGWRLFVYGWVLISVALAFSLRCVSVIDKQNKEKIEQLTEQVDSLKALYETGHDVKNL